MRQSILDNHQDTRWCGRQTTSNLALEDVKLLIQDVRTSQNSYYLDVKEFEFRKHFSKLKSFQSKAASENIYLLEVEAR